MANLQGVDLSWWQQGTYKGFIDTYAKDFVIARATFGRSVDAVCDRIYQYAKSKGKKLGFYLFPLTSEGDAGASAEWHYNQVKGYIGEAVPCIDWEATNGTNVADTAWALAFAKKFEELSGVKPVFYMNSSTEASYDWSAVVANNNGLWVANYGSNNGSDNGYSAPKYWKVVALHQFTSRLGGQNLDGDVFFGGTAEWDKYAGKASASKPTPAPQPVEKPLIEEPKQQIEEPQENPQPVENSTETSETNNRKEEEMPKIEPVPVPDQQEVIGIVQEASKGFNIPNWLKLTGYIIGDTCLYGSVAVPFIFNMIQATDLTAYATYLSGLLMSTGILILTVFKLIKR